MPRRVTHLVYVVLQAAINTLLHSLNSFPLASPREKRVKSQRWLVMSRAPVYQYLEEREREREREMGGDGEFDVCNGCQKA